MSRSTRKPIVKDKNRYSQKLGNRRMRAKTRDMMKHEKFDNLPVDKSEVINDWDVSDWRWFDKDVKNTRK